MAQGLAILAEVRERFGMPVLTDVHAADQCAPAAEAVDVLQIPAFLCRQTDLLIAAGETGRGDQREEGPVPGAVGHGECRGQDRRHRQRQHPAVRARRELRLQHAGQRHARAADHGARPAIRWCSTPRIRCSSRAGRARHRAASGSSRRCWRARRWRSACAAVFIETHPDPDRAPSDGPNMIPLRDMPALIARLKAFDRLAKA